MAEGSVSDGIRLPDVQGSGAQGTNPHPDLISITTIYCKSTINDRYAKIWLWRREVSKPLGIHTRKKLLQS